MPSRAIISMTRMLSFTNILLLLLISSTFTLPTVVATLPATLTIKRLGSVDLGILAETTPIVWNDELWLMECIQGKKYYGNLNGESYIRFTNPFTGKRTPHFAIGYGLGNAVVENETMFVFATKTPYGISTNNTEVSVFWSKDIMSASSWNTNVAIHANDDGVIPDGCAGRKKSLWNTCVQKGIVNGKATFIMAYEYNCGNPGWQTHFAIGKAPPSPSSSSSSSSSDGEETSLAFYDWDPIPYENEHDFTNISHANPTIRWNQLDGYWYLLSTRGADRVLVEDIYRTKNPLDFSSWKPPTGWSVTNPLAAPLIAPSAEDQNVSPANWHPDTKAIVEGNKTAVKKAKNINTSDMDLCTAMINGQISTVLYWAWGDQMLGPTAMVLSVGIVEGKSMEEFLSSVFVATSTTDVEKKQEKNIINDDIVLKLNNNIGQNEELYTLMHDNYYYHRECIHIHDDTFKIENLQNGDEHVTVNGKKSLYKKCPYPRIHRSSINDNKINNNNNIVIDNKQQQQNVESYYSDWVAYAKATTPNTNLFTFFNSTWKVPPPPTSKGPFGLSSVYLFNGLEDGAGHAGNASLILQPVLSYGKSGCILNPIDWGKWNIVSYLVSGSGRAHCGKRIEVEEGDEIVGTMINKGNNNWEVDAIRVKTNEKSSYISQLPVDKTIDAAYITLEGMIIYGCNAFPNGSTTFFNNQLKTTSSITSNTINGMEEETNWVKIIKHNECKQNVLINNQEGNVTIVYKQ